MPRSLALQGFLARWLSENAFSVIIPYGHSCASLLLANGVPLKAIQEWLGHSDFAITANIYAHLEYKSKVASAEAMKWIEDTSLAGNNMQTEGESGGKSGFSNSTRAEKPVTARKNGALSKHSSKHGQKTAKKQ